MYIVQRYKGSRYCIVGNYLFVYVHTHFVTAKICIFISIFFFSYNSHTYGKKMVMQGDKANDAIKFQKIIYATFWNNTVLQDGTYLYCFILWIQIHFYVTYYNTKITIEHDDRRFKIMFDGQIEKKISTSKKYNMVGNSSVQLSIWGANHQHFWWFDS